MDVDATQVLDELRAQADPRTVEGMTRVGINPRATLGVQIPSLQKMARKIGSSHEIAAQLWASGLHEARILAAMVEDPALITAGQMDRWAAAFDSWDVCDQVCKYAFARTPLAYDKAREWPGHSGQFVKRAGFSLMADLAVNDKKAGDGVFLSLLELCEREASDDRNYVKKAVNWALRQIGKRNLSLNEAALACAQRIQAQGSRSSSWIAADAIRELNSAAGKLRSERPAATGRTKTRAAGPKAPAAGGSDSAAKPAGVAKPASASKSGVAKSAGAAKAPAPESPEAGVPEAGAKRPRRSRKPRKEEAAE